MGTVPQTAASASLSRQGDLKQAAVTVAFLSQVYGRCGLNYVSFPLSPQQEIQCCNSTPSPRADTSCCHPSCFSFFFFFSSNASGEKTPDVVASLLFPGISCPCRTTGNFSQVFCPPSFLLLPFLRALKAGSGIADETFLYVQISVAPSAPSSLLFYSPPFSIQGGAIQAVLDGRMDYTTSFSREPRRGDGLFFRSLFGLLLPSFISSSSPWSVQRSIDKQRRNAKISFFPV